MLPGAAGERWNCKHVRSLSEHPVGFQSYDGLNAPVPELKLAGQPHPVPVGHQSISVQNQIRFGQRMEIRSQSV